MNKVILVDENDKILGLDEKMKVHMEGKLHRAFSLIVFNSRQEMLLQKRAKDKYHSGGLWSNTCCSHQIEDNDEATIHKRLVEEMGFDCQLTWKFSFRYKHVFENNVIENELDHVYVGNFDGEVKVNPLEVELYKWIGIDDLLCEIKSHPQDFSVWFKIIIENHLNRIV